jgi:hypothetical protein
MVSSTTTAEGGGPMASPCCRPVPHEAFTAGVKAREVAERAYSYDAEAVLPHSDRSAGKYSPTTPSCSWCSPGSPQRPLLSLGEIGHGSARLPVPPAQAEEAFRG